VPEVILINSERDGVKFMERIKAGPAFIIAEAGVNHNGDITLAHKLVDAACDAGADSVKFQSFTAEGVAIAQAETAAYQQEATGARNQAELLNGLELSRELHEELLAHCVERNILFLSTPHDWASIDLLDKLNITAFKIGSGDLTNLPFLTAVAVKQRPIILSTGMGTLAEVGEAVQTVTSANNNQLVLLHGVSKYPALIEESNLTVMEVMAKAFGFPVGYSDHTIGIDTTLAAVALGARVIEKHFTLNARLSGPDHAISLEPGAFKSMVNGIRRVELALGSGIKAPTEGEISMRAISRKSIVSARAILAGTRITAEMLTTKRPGTGIQPRDWDAVIGRRVKANMLDDSMLQWKDIE